MRPTNQELAVYDTRSYNERLHEFAMRVLVAQYERHEFMPISLTNDVVDNAYKCAEAILHKGFDYELSLETALDCADEYDAMEKGNE